MRLPIAAFLACVAASAAAQSTFQHRPSTPVRPAGAPLTAVVLGRGSVPVVAITGHTHGAEFYASLVSRTESQYTFHILVPPGMGGTPAYSWPAEPERLDTEEWTTRFAADAEAYVARTFRGERPILLGAWDTGIGQALRLASRTPSVWRSVVLVGWAPYQRWHRPPSLDALDSFDIRLQRTERLPNTMTFWRTVPESVWHRNTYAASAYSMDTALAARLKAEERRRPFEISLRYFAEFLWGDHQELLRQLRTPTVIVAPIAPADSAAQARSRRAWQGDRNSCIAIRTAGTRMMPWVDAPEPFDRILAEAARATPCTR